MTKQLRGSFGRFWLVSALFLCCRAYGLDPNRAPSEYVLEQWGAGQGFTGGAVYSIAQTPDGYLWIGCEAGLVRFDGIAFERLSGEPALARPVQQLLTDAEGTLWIREQNMALFRLRDGKAEDVLHRWGFDNAATAMTRGQQGEAIFWIHSEALWCCKGDRLQPAYHESRNRSMLPIALAETTGRRLWLGSRDAGLMRLEGEAVTDYMADVPDPKVNVILSESNGKLWIGTDGGARRWDGSHITSEGVPRELRNARILSLNRDHEGNLWIGSNDALFRVGPGSKADRVRPHQIFGVNTIFEDRESNLWIGTESGLERLRDPAFVSYREPEEQTRTQQNSPVYVDGQARTWYSASGGNVNWRCASLTGSIRIGGPSDTIYSISGRGRDVWVGRKFGGLTHIHCGERCRVVRSYTEADGLSENAVTSVLAAADGSVWAGTASRGVSRLQRDKFVVFTAPYTLNSNSIHAIAETPDGATWFATSKGLSAQRGGVWRRYDASDGLPPGVLSCLTVDQEGVVWIGASYGLAFVEHNRIHTVQWAAAFDERVLGVTVGGNNWLWITTPSHILQVERSAAIAGRIGTGDRSEFSTSDGLVTASVLKRSPAMTRDASGRIWLATNRGLSVIDPVRLAAQLAPVPPHVQQISADGADLTFSNEVRVPAGRKRIVFDFIGLNLTAPQRVRYRYRLDNFDAGWSNPVAIREAVYTNLPHGTYRFRLRASNHPGIWNGEEDAITVRVDAEFWQTWWFQTAAVLLAGLCAATIYRQRLESVKDRLNMRFEERLLERTRIAQELHDTLLQEFLSASMQLHVVSNRLQEDSPARAPLQRAMELMRRAGDEGRVALRQLRSEEEAISLEDAFARIRNEAMMSEDVIFRLRVEGHTRPLRPVLRDDVYCISREAIVNAIRHSGAVNIEVEVSYEPHLLRVVVQDDGCGIDPDLMKSGREGHWGLRGMRERAERIRGKLSLLSSPGRGTEVVLRVPGNLAYKNHKQRLGASRPVVWSRMSSLVRRALPGLYGHRKQNSNT